MIDLITVVFQEEISLLRVQAQSINQYFDSDSVNQITVVVNDHDHVIEHIDCAWWGKHQHRVKIKPVSAWHYPIRVNGWENQQLCKLLAASEADSDWSMVLDAKTWFIRSCNNLFDSQGRAQVGRSGIFTPFRDSQQFVEKYYNISMPEVIGPSGVPFMFHTATVHDLVHSVDNFADFFQTAVRYPNLVTEFHLYSGHVIAQGLLDQLYSRDCAYGLVNVAEWETDSFDLLFEQMQRPDVLTVSIHKKSYANLTNDQLQSWYNFLAVKNLLQTTNQQFDKLNTSVNH